MKTDKLANQPYIFDRLKDEISANRAGGHKMTPKGFIWHHHQEPGRMQLVDKNIHQKTGHSGGFSLWGKAVVE